MKLHRLTVKEVEAARSGRKLYDGDGLLLDVGPGNARSWLYRYSINGRERCLSLGSANVISLARARELAGEARRLRAEGVDPLEHRKAERDAAMALKSISFEQAAERYFDDKKS